MTWLAPLGSILGHSVSPSPPQLVGRCLWHGWILPSLASRLPHPDADDGDESVASGGGRRDALGPRSRGVSPGTRINGRGIPPPLWGGVSPRLFGPESRKSKSLFFQGFIFWKRESVGNRHGRKYFLLKSTTYLQHRTHD